MSDTPKLLPCPFCGGEGKAWANVSQTTWKKKRGELREPVRAWNVRCLGDCGANMGVWDNKQDAIEQWNSRVDSAWSSDPPSKEGWYWVLVDYFKPFPVRIVDHGFGFQVMQPGEESLIKLNEVFPGHHAKWLELSEPELPPSE